MQRSRQYHTHRVDRTLWVTPFFLLVLVSLACSISAPGIPSVFATPTPTPQPLPPTIIETVPQCLNGPVIAQQSEYQCQISSRPRVLSLGLVEDLENVGDGVRIPTVEEIRDNFDKIDSLADAKLEKPSLRPPQLQNKV